MARKIISCPACNARFDVARYPAGSRVRCGRCSQVLTVPSEEGDAVPAPGSEPGATRGAPMASPPSVSVSQPAAPRTASRGVAPPLSRPAQEASLPPASAPASAPAPRPEPPSAPAPAAVSTPIGTPSAPDRDPLIGRTVNGQFRVVRKLGEGGYGAVYEAKDVNLERRIALKIMLPSRAASREYVAKFFREARTAAQLSHPNVVAVHGVGLDKENNVYFLAMEYVEGRTLHDVLQEKGPLPVAEAVDYMIQSCRGLAAAHERAIIHRDIKPGNLMITPAGVIKIADFGLAKIYEGEGGQQSTVIGTPYFMPPEQFEGKAKDGRTDIYALGVTFYYMLTLQRAHSGAGPAQILLSVMTKEPTSVLDHRPDLPEGIWPIVRKMIDRDIEKRYSNCNEIIRDLEQLMGGGEQDVEQVYCPSCGAPNAVDATACTACRVSLLEKCPVCGVEDAAGTKFCGNCGSNIPAERAVAALADEARAFLAAGRLARAREKLQQAHERSPDNLAVGDLFKELEARREARDAHCESIRELISRGRVNDAAERLKLARSQFPEAHEILELAKEVDEAMAGPETTGMVPGASLAMGEARRLEEAGRIREALVAWRGVRLLVPNTDEAKAGEARTAELVQRAELLLTEGTELLQNGDPEEALMRLVDANAILPRDPLVEGRLKEAGRMAEELRTEIATAQKEIAAGRAANAVPRLRALCERYPRSKAAADTLSEADLAGREANRGAVRERLAKAIATAKSHETGKRLRDAAQAWREAASLDPDSIEASEGLAHAERRIAEFDAILGQSRSLIAAGDPEGAERAAAEALAIVAGDPAAEAQLARARTQVETLRHEAERIRTALSGEPDDEVLSWARDLSSRYPASALAAEVLHETNAKCREAAEKAASKRASGQIERARKLEGEGNPLQAVRAYQDVLREFPDHEESKQAIARLGQRVEEARRKAAEAASLLEAGDPDGARAAAEASLAILPDERQPSGVLAASKTALSEIERATQSFTAILPADRATQQLERLRRLRAKYPRSAAAADLEHRAEKALADASRLAQAAKVRQLVESAKEAVLAGRLADATRLSEEALALDADDAGAKETLETAQDRISRARALAAEGRLAAGAGRHAEARAKFDAALVADPSLTEAVTGRDASAAALQRAAAALSEAVEKANAASRTAGPVEAAAAWERVAALDPTHRHAQEELARLRGRIERANADVLRGRAALDAGDPESAVVALEAARAALGPGDTDTMLARAREAAAEIAKSLRELESSMSSTDGDLGDAAALAAGLATRFPGSARVRDAAAHAAAAALERRRAMAVTRVRKLVRDRRYVEARDLAVSLKAEGVSSADLSSAAQQAIQAIAKIEELRQRAAKARGAGRLEDAREALREVLVSLPDDHDTKNQINEIDETIREVAARRDAADAARRRGAVTHAIELYREALALQGASEEFQAEIAKLAGEVGERTRLLRACEEAVRTGDGKACVDGAKRLLDRYPEDDDARDLHTTGDCMERMTSALFSRAQRQIAAGEREAATQTLECLLRVAPGHAKARDLMKA